MASQQKDEWFHNIHRKITIFTIWFSTLDSVGKSGILFIWYNLIGLPFSDNFIQTTPPRQKIMIFLALPLQILALTPYISVIWAKGYRDKNVIGNIQMIKALTTIPLFSLSRASECFRSTNLTVTLLSCPLLLLESGSLWQPLISFRSISTPGSLEILITAFSRSLSGMLFDMPDVSMLFLRLYCSPFAWFFSSWRPVCG